MGGMNECRSWGGGETCMCMRAYVCTCRPMPPPGACLYEPRNNVKADPGGHSHTHLHIAIHPSIHPSTARVTPSYQAVGHRSTPLP